jgi:uncharacterized protein with von Willebrand factor type A (vWA) domain
MLDVTEALQHVNVGARDEVYHACRTLLVHRYDDLAIFDRAFDAFWSRRDLGGPVECDGSDEPESRSTDSQPGRERSDGHEPDDRDEAGNDIGVLRTWSDVSRLATKDFADFTADEVNLARAALSRLVWNPGERRTRRWIRGRGPRLDVAGALGRSIRTGGDVVALPRRRRRIRERRVVLLCDVSGSMERYSRMLLHFAHALGRRHRRLEAFLFSTRLTRVTTELQSRKLEHAVAAISRAVPDWSGGTRIGDALKTLRRPSMRRVLYGRPVVLLVSDGWDGGDPLVLRDEMARLQRNCRRLIWLNPLIGTVNYAPLTRGLQAALPYVDDFLPARTLMNLADLAEHLNNLSAR